MILSTDDPVYSCFFPLVVRGDTEGEPAAVDSKYFHHLYLRLSLLPVTTSEVEFRFIEHFLSA